jgi:hypothetical protein
MKRCPACDRTYGGWADPQHHEVCRRVRATAKQWWEREPGWVKDDIRRAQRRPALFNVGRSGYWNLKPGTQLTLSALSARIPDNGAWILERRAALKLDRVKAA